MRAVRLSVAIALCTCVVFAVLVAQGCSKSSTNGGAGGPTKLPAAKGTSTKTPDGGPAPNGGPAGGGTESQPKLAVGTTLQNLQAAYDGESNASARYAAFAKKADEEGYKQVAAFFRAASRAEGIHAENHAGVITKMGETPKADVQPPEVKTTKENLQTAVTGESYEVGTMYPAFLRVAVKDKNADAVRSMTGALKAEAEHTKLITEALRDLQSWRTVAASIWVCPVCGFTVKNPIFTKCPTCGTDRSQFEEFK